MRRTFVCSPGQLTHVSRLPTAPPHQWLSSFSVHFHTKVLTTGANTMNSHNNKLFSGFFQNPGAFYFKIHSCTPKYIGHCHQDPRILPSGLGGIVLSVDRSLSKASPGRGHMTLHNHDLQHIGRTLKSETVPDFLLSKGASVTWRMCLDKWALFSELRALSKLFTE